ncbi:septum formation initiator family protein [Streptomyces broussonetiae]|uniref:Septum formation initiator family protein n=1 Tax=Streptomyces broussonetiae TaxID=2686304 RepID=A0A6I6MUY7_9ACTN|nr:septum formation initiator family protein [Streptomyces broussonetiae]QHA04153.1 septum formation initiator family protein [Streptomyces broussonetiae]
MSRKPELRGRAARLARLFPAGRARAARTPFVLLVVLVLGGGLIGLLVLNSALSEGSFKLADLQKRTKSLTDEEQALQRDIDAYSSPDALQRRAHELGMVPGGDPAFLGPGGTVKGVPSAAAHDAAAFTAPVVPETMTPAAAPPASPATPLSASPDPAAALSASPDPAGALSASPDPAGALPGSATPALSASPARSQGTPAPSAPAAAVPPPPIPQTASTPTPGR